MANRCPKKLMDSERNNCFLLRKKGKIWDGLFFCFSLSPLLPSSVQLSFLLLHASIILPSTRSVSQAKGDCGCLRDNIPAANGCTWTDKRATSKTHAANAVLLSTMCTHAHTRADPITLPNTTTVTNERTLVWSLKVNSNQYAPGTFIWPSWRVAAAVMCAWWEFLISVLSAWDTSAQS